jgi:ubiquinone/menaquinone biosynthesis C-methylase UbiE
VRIERLKTPKEIVMRSLRLRLTLLLVTMLAPCPAAWAQRSGSTILSQKIFDAIGAREGMTVCEIGAGDGELSLAVARIVGPSGGVLASELGAEHVKALQDRVAGSSLAQITVVTGDPVKTNFPDAGCDALFMRNVYHHFADPAAMNASIASALKPGARVGVVDFTPPAEEAPRPNDRGKDGMHGVRAETVSREMNDAGLEPVSSDTGDQRWFMVVVLKPKR